MLPKKFKVSKNSKKVTHENLKGEYNAKESKIFVGAHVSIKGGVQNSILEAASIGAQAFGLFLCNQRTWNVKPLNEGDADSFRKLCRQYDYDPHLIVPHGSYLINCGSPDKDSFEKSKNLLLDGARRCDKLGIGLYNFHPGSTCGKCSVDDSINKIAKAINFVHKHTDNVILLIENMCRQGNTVGGSFEELKNIINKVENKKRIGVCFDTCHAFAAGYDIKSEKGYKETFEQFDKIIGLKYLKALHLNDSKGMLGSHLDRHENIGKGLLGMDFFKRIMKDSIFENIPMILETPADDNDVYKKEIKKLYSL